MIKFLLNLWLSSGDICFYCYLRKPRAKFLACNQVTGNRDFTSILRSFGAFSFLIVVARYCTCEGDVEENLAVKKNQVV